MSYANFGPTYLVESVINAQVAAIPIPTTAVGTALTNTTLIRLADGVTEVPLTLGPGVWVLRGKCFFEPLAAGAMGVQYAQAYILNLTSNDIVASSTAISGAAFAAGQDHVQVAMNLDVIVMTPVTCAKLPPRAGVAYPVTFHKFWVVATELIENVD